MPKPLTPEAEEHLARVRRICLALPEATEKLSHGEPTFFVAKKVFAMFADHHHEDGHLAVWIPVEPGAKATLIATASRLLPPALCGRERLGGRGTQSDRRRGSGRPVARSVALIAPAEAQRP